MSYECISCGQRFGQMNFTKHLIEDEECWIKIWDHGNNETNDEKKLESDIHVHSQKQEESNIIGPEPFLSSNTYDIHPSTSSGIQESKNILYEYDDYNQKFCRKNELTNHLTQKHKGVMHQCDHCNYEFKDEKHLMSHIRYVHPNIQEETNSAQPGPSWEDGQYSKYSNRNSCIENNRPYESCKVCQQRFHRKLELIYHYKNVHQRLMHQCEHCAYETNNEEDLKSHMQFYHSNVQKESNRGEHGPSWESDPCGKHSSTNSCIENNMPYECDVCDQRFHKRYELIYHYKNAHRRLMYQCEHCIYGTNDEEDMKSHIRDHSNNQEESIIIDPEPSLKSDSGVKHSRKHSCIENIPHEYDVCNQKFRKINEEHLESQVQCVHPNIQEEDNSAEPGPSWQSDTYGKHASRNSCSENNMPYECTVCNQRFDRTLKLAYHYKNVHQRLMPHCEHRAYETNDKNLKDHVRRVYPNVQKESNSSEPGPSRESEPCAKYTSINNNKKKYKLDWKCQVCNQELSGNQKLMHHLAEVHGIQAKFNCSQCNYKTNLHYLYYRHWKAMHEDNYDYPCTEPGCERAYKTRTGLWRHMHVKHSNEQEKSNIVDLKLSSESHPCGKHSTRKSSVETYERKPALCPVCNRRFRFQKELIDHLIKDHGRRTIYNCSHCSYETNHRQSYERHNKRKHEDNYDYVCTVPNCNWKGKLQCDLIRHMQRVHHNKQKKSGSTNAEPSLENDS
ncbi:zinc finger protein Xfin-like [Harpegnathos saltator]|uniref:zinc finger protein Xfin-like n=1 Tax=Harpegnathos saltator TaxID=610380 RepID=UPI000DBEEA96|nr:zinc finger protein Xfin-like [Harpegnathos saltator]